MKNENRNSKIKKKRSKIINRLYPLLYLDLGHSLLFKLRFYIL